MGRAADRDHARRVAGGGAEQGRPRDVDHLDRLVDADLAAPDLGRERLDVDDDEVDQPDAVLHELLELLRARRGGRGCRRRSRVEGPDLAADERRDRGEVGDRRGLDAVGGEMLARAVRGEELVAQRLELTRERGDARRGSRPRAAHAPARFLLRRSSVWRPAAAGIREGSEAAPRAGASSAASIPWPPWHTRTAHQRAGPSRPLRRRARVQLWPWEYLFESFDATNFPDLYMPILVASVAVLIATVIFYNVRTRQLHRHTRLPADVRVAAVDERDRCSA